MTLISPSGRVIDRDTIAPDVEHDQGATFEVTSEADTLSRICWKATSS